MINSKNKMALVSLKSHHKSFNHLIKDLRDQAGYKIGDIAKSLGIHRNSQANYESNREPSIEYLVEFSVVVGYPFWHLMMQRVRFSSNDKALIKTVLAEMVLLQGGQGQQQYESAVELQWLATLCKRNPAIKVYQHCGNAMRPTINDGGRLFIDTSHTKVNDGEIYLVNIGKQYTARRLQHYPGDGLLVIGDNPQIKPIKITSEYRDSFEVVGKLLVSINIHQAN